MSTKQTITSHLNHWTWQGQRHMEFQILTWDRHKLVAMSKQENDITNPNLLITAFKLHLLFPLSLPRLLPSLTVYTSILWDAGSVYPSRAPEFNPGVHVPLLFSFLCFPIMFGSSLAPLVCRYDGSCLIYVICVCLSVVVSNTYCVVFLFCLSSSMLAVSLDCPFWLTFWYYLTYM